MSWYHLPLVTRSEISGHLPIVWQKPLHGTHPLWSLSLPGHGTPGQFSSTISRMPGEKPWQRPTASGQLPVLRYLPHSAGTRSGTGYIPKILIYGQCFQEVKTHGGTSLTPGRQSEDKAALRSPQSKAKNNIAGVPRPEPVLTSGAVEETQGKKDQPRTLVIPEHPPDETSRTGTAGRPFWSGTITIGLVNVPV